eukprot:7362513-Karenia_brevis.AAC.1
MAHVQVEGPGPFGEAAYHALGRLASAQILVLEWALEAPVSVRRIATVLSKSETEKQTMMMMMMMMVMMMMMMM